MAIAREGWPVIGTAAGVLGLVGAVGALAGHPAALVPLVLAVGFCLYFFRDPERSAPPDERLVVSPADGRVVAVAAEREERVLGAQATRVTAAGIHSSRYAQIFTRASDPTWTKSASRSGMSTKIRTMSVRSTT